MKGNKLFLLSIAVILILMVGCSNDKKLPDKPIRPKITIAKKEINYVGGSSCWSVSENEGICTDPPHPDYFYAIVREEATVVAKPESVLKIKFPIKPDEFYLSVTNVYGKQESIGKPDQYSYTLPSKPGNYRYVLSAAWEVRNTASYNFVVQIEE